MNRTNESSKPQRKTQNKYIFDISQGINEKIRAPSHNLAKHCDIFKEFA